MKKLIGKVCRVNLPEYKVVRSTIIEGILSDNKEIIAALKDPDAVWNNFGRRLGHLTLSEKLDLIEGAK